MEVKKDGDKLTITVELSKNPQPSTSGKSTVMYTSHGFQWIEGVGINLTIIKSKRTS